MVIKEDEIMGQDQDTFNVAEKFVLGTWDIVAVVGYFVLILGVGMMVSKNCLQMFC